MGIRQSKPPPIIVHDGMSPFGNDNYHVPAYIEEYGTFFDKPMRNDCTCLFFWPWQKVCEKQT